MTSHRFITAQNQDDYAQALLLYQRTLAILEKVLEKDHPNTHTVLANYNSLLNEMKN